MPRRKKQIVIPYSVDLKEIEPFIEHNIEVDKPTLISRIAGKVNYGLLQMLKMQIFNFVGRDEKGQIYFL